MTAFNKHHFLTTKTNLLNILLTQQWVFEVCFPTGSYDNNNGNDLQFMDDLMAKIELESIPAHAPIEQRWSASSSSLMSPAHGSKDGLHCWVG